MENVHVDVFLYFDHPDHTREASVLPIPIVREAPNKDAALAVTATHRLECSIFQPHIRHTIGIPAGYYHVLDVAMFIVPNRMR